MSVDAYQKQVFLEVPTFLLGYPSFDVAKASAYLKRQLINSGFRVESMSQTVFNVSWYTEKEKKEKERLDKERIREERRRREGRRRTTAQVLQRNLRQWRRRNEKGRNP